jgi:hypothetical protein
MITNYTELKQAVSKWLLRDTSDRVVTTDQVENYIQLCETELNRVLKIRDLEETQDYVTSTTEDFLLLPDGFRGVKTFEFDTEPYDIECCATRRDMKKKFTSATGRPQAYIILGGKVVFNCQPDAAYAMTMDFFEEIPPLTSGNPTNVILEKHPDVYLYGAQKHALIQIGDKDKLDTVATNYKGTVDDLLEDDKNSRIPSGTAMKPQRRNRGMF